jgi:hypothetical protein
MLGLRITLFLAAITGVAVEVGIHILSGRREAWDSELYFAALPLIGLAAGALDVWWTPITMKKGRPALLLSALATAETRGAVAAAILRETTTIGVRYAERERTILARSIREVATPYGAIAVKIATDGDTILNAAPEFEACVAAARRHGVPVKLVFAAAQAAFEATR